MIGNLLQIFSLFSLRRRLDKDLSILTFGIMGLFVDGQLNGQCISLRHCIQCMTECIQHPVYVTGVCMQDFTCRFGYRCICYSWIWTTLRTIQRSFVFYFFTIHVRIDLKRWHKPIFKRRFNSVIDILSCEYSNIMILLLWFYWKLKQSRIFNCIELKMNEFCF